MLGSTERNDFCSQGDLCGCHEDNVCGVRGERQQAGGLEMGVGGGGDLFDKIQLFNVLQAVSYGHMCKLT